MEEGVLGSIKEGTALQTLAGINPFKENVLILFALPKKLSHLLRQTKSQEDSSEVMADAVHQMGSQT